MKNNLIQINNFLFATLGRLRFNRICKYNDITLSYKANKNELAILTDIFENREYSNYFPFYENVTIVDIGSHYGYFSIFASKNTDAKSRIISIEPSFDNFESFKNNIRDNNIENITPINCAIGPNDSSADFYLGKSSNNSLIPQYSLLNQKKKTQRVEIKTLPTIILENKIETIDFLKMDCEGGEYSILENLEENTFKKIKTISMEFHDFKNQNQSGETILKLLRKNGFSIVKYEYDKTTKGLNFGKIIGTRLYKDM